MKMLLPETIPERTKALFSTIIAPENRSVLRLVLVSILLMNMLWLIFGIVSWDRQRRIRKFHPTRPTPKRGNATFEIDNRPFIDLTKGDYEELAPNARPPNDYGFSAADVSPEQNAPMTPERAAFEFFAMKQRVSHIEKQLGIKSQWPEMTR